MYDFLSKSGGAAYAYAQFGDIKYPAGFHHFEWVNPDASKGGEIALVPPLRMTQFDKYNPFTLKRTSPPGLGELMFESLLTGTVDEPTTAYGLLADEVAVAPDRLSAIFRLHFTARAKGVSERGVLWCHVFRNALIPIMTGFPAAFVGAFFTGSLLIETLFSLDGLGLLSYESVIRRDYPVVLGSLFFFALIGLVTTLIRDLRYLWVDPRVKYD